MCACASLALKCRIEMEIRVMYEQWAHTVVYHRSLFAASLFLVNILSLWSRIDHESDSVRTLIWQARRYHAFMRFSFRHFFFFFFRVRRLPHPKESFAIYKIGCWCVLQWENDENDFEFLLCKFRSFGMATALHIYFIVIECVNSGECECKGQRGLHECWFKFLFH